MAEEKNIPQNNEVEEEKSELNNTKESETDAFGVDDSQRPSDDKKPDEKSEDKKFDAIPEDHPTIVGLKQQIEDVKKEYGGNLSGQRDIIKTLEGKIDALTKGGGKEEEGEKEVIYKDIKWSKDLTKEEREEMTDTEIKQMDEIAEMKTKQNEIFTKQQEKEKESSTKKVEDLNKTVQDFAKEISRGEDGKDNLEVANQIIEQFKNLNFNTENDSLDDIKKKVEISASQVPDFKPAKEQENKQGKPITDNTTSDDQFGTDAIIEEATKESDGNYQL